MHYRDCRSSGQAVVTRNEKSPRNFYACIAFLLKEWASVAATTCKSKPIQLLSSQHGLSAAGNQAARVSRVLRQIYGLSQIMQQDALWLETSRTGARCPPFGKRDVQQ